MKTYSHMPGLLALLLLPAMLGLAPSARAAKVIRLKDGSYTTIEESRSRPDRVTQETEADKRLESAVKQALQAGACVGVTAENGVVTLRGKVNSAKQRLDLVRAAQSVSGVTSVRAELAVPGEYNENEEIKEKNRQLGVGLF